MSDPPRLERGDGRDDFTPQEIALFTQAHRIAQHLGIYPWRDDFFRVAGVVVRCHELARAYGHVLGLECCDGWYGMVEHTWLWSAKFSRWAAAPNILDVYAPGRLPQVQLVHTTNLLPFEYRRGDPRKDVDFETVMRLVRAMEGAL